MSIMKLCKSCRCEIPQKRADLGYVECVQCSTTEKYGFVNIINHKTGNTIQTMKKEQADAINKIGDRKRFGTVLRSGSKSTTYNPKNIKHGGCSVYHYGSEAMFNSVGERAMIALETKGLKDALAIVQKRLTESVIDKFQASKLRQMLTYLAAEKE